MLERKKKTTPDDSGEKTALSNLDARTLKAIFFVAAWYAIAAAATLLLLLPALSTDFSRPIHRYLASMATLFTNKHLLSNVGVGAQVRALRTHTPLLRLQRLPRVHAGARRRKHAKEREPDMSRWLGKLKRRKSERWSKLNERHLERLGCRRESLS